MPESFSYEPEVVLQGDRGEGLVLLADAQPLLGLDRLVEPLRVPAPLEDAPGELIDDETSPSRTMYSLSLR